MRSTKQVLDALEKHLTETGGRCGAVMAACDVSETSVRRWRERRRLPKNRLVREALERFLSGGGK